MKTNAPGTQNGIAFRVKGREAKRGVYSSNLMVTIEVQVPQRVDGQAKHAQEEFTEVTKSEELRTYFLQRSRV